MYNDGLSRDKWKFCFSSAIVKLVRDYRGVASNAREHHNGSFKISMTLSDTKHEITKNCFIKVFLSTIYQM